MSAPLAGKLESRGAAIAFLVLCTAIVYGNSLSNDFVWDDLSVVLPRIESSRIADIPGLFLQADTAGNVGTPYYRPLNLSTYVLDSVLYGDRPAGYHLTNLLLHVLAAVALYLVSLELFALEALALLAALLFAVHPINTESVDFISARNNILAGLFVLMSLHAYALHARRRGAHRLAASACFFFLGLLCKETAAMLLVFLALYEGIAFRRRPRVTALAARLWPFAVFLALYLALRANALHGSPGLDPRWDELVSRLSLNLTILPRYLGLIFAPIGLSISRLPPDGGYPLTVWTALSWLAIAGALYALWRSDSAPTRLGLLWFAVHYVPISNAVPIPSAPMAERFLYLPAVGLWWVLADQLCRVYRKANAKRLIWAAAAAALLALACVSGIRNLAWRSTVTLFEAEVRVHPSLAENHYNLCTAYFEAGALARAETACREADRLDPGNAGVLTQLGNLQQAQRRRSDALDYYARAVAADPRHVTARYNLARLLEGLGRPGEALPHYRALEGALPPGHFLGSDVRLRLRGIEASLEAPPEE